jgi:hypothetical protein
MRLDELEHLLRAASDIVKDNEFFVFGSQAILASYPNAPIALLHSNEADLSPRNKKENKYTFLNAFS